MATTGIRCPRCGLDTGDNLHRSLCPQAALARLPVDADPPTVTITAAYFDPPESTRFPADGEDVERDRALDGDPDKDEPHF